MGVKYSYIKDIKLNNQSLVKILKIEFLKNHIYYFKII